MRKRYRVQSEMRLNPCNANLVDHAVDWPGFTTARATLRGEPLVFPAVDYSAYYEACKRDHYVKLEEFVRSWEVPIEPLPCWADLPAEEQQAKAVEAVAAAEQVARAKRQAEHKTVMGVRAVQAVKPTDRPRHSKRSNRPLCHTTDRDLFFAYRNHYYEFQRGYRAASALYRAGHFDTIFPSYSIRPPMLYPT